MSSGASPNSPERPDGGEANKVPGSRRHRWPSKRRGRGSDKLGAEIRAYLDLTEDIHDMRPEDWSESSE